MNKRSSKRNGLLITLLDSFISSGTRIFSYLIARVLNLEVIRKNSLSLDIINFHGPKTSEMIIREYLENYSFPKYGVKMLKRYPVTAVFCEKPIRRHRLNDVVFFDSEIKSKEDVEELLMRAVFRSFLQKTAKKGIQVTYGNIDRLHEVFHKRFDTSGRNSQADGIVKKHEKST